PGGAAAGGPTEAGRQDGDSGRAELRRTGTAADRETRRWKLHAAHRAAGALRTDDRGGPAAAAVTSSLPVRRQKSRPRPGAFVDPGQRRWLNSRSSPGE